MSIDMSFEKLLSSLARFSYLQEKDLKIIKKEAHLVFVQTLLLTY